MDLRQLRYFLAIAEARSLSKASRTLNVAQSALSRQVRALEEDLGVTLLLRTSTGVHLTEAGARLRESAAYALRYLDDLRTDLRTLSAEPSGELLLGLPPSVASLIAPRLVELARARHPLLTLHVIEGLSVFLLDWLEGGRVDMAVLTDPGPQRRLDRVPLAEEDMVLVGLPDLVGPRDRVRVAADLDALPLILSRGFRRVVQPWLDAQGADLRGDTELDSIPVIKEMLRRGLFATIAPYGMVHEEIAAGLFRAVPLGEPTVRRRIVLGLDSNRPMSSTMRAVRALVEETLAEVPLQP